MRVALLILSPHLDDAVLSACFQLIRVPGTTVATVFAGVPAAEQPPGAWDLLTRAASARDRVLQRRAEDQAALSHLGARPLWLDEPDGQHRAGAIDRAQLAKLLCPLIESASELWLPAGIGNHRDHVGLRDAALDACRTVGTTSIHLYADVPYASAYGLPVRSDHGQFLDTEFWLRREMGKCGLYGWQLTWKNHELCAQMSERKRLAVGEYRSQLAALGIKRQLTMAGASLLDWELSWEVGPVSPG